MTDRLKPSRRRIFLQTMLQVLAASLCAVIFAACGKHEAIKEPETRVTVAHPHMAEVSEHIDLTGTVGAFQSVTNVARVSGYLESIDFADGSFVKKGTLLFKVQQEQYIQDLNLYQAKLDYSAAEYNRQAKLFEKNATSQNSVQQYLSEMNQDQANVALAKLNLEYTTVYAPFDGLLGEHMVDVGNMVGANAAMPTAIVTIEQIDPIYVNFSINTRDALRLRRMMEAAGMAIKSGVNTAPVLAQLEDETNFPHEGVLDFSNNGVDTSTGTIQLRGIFANPQKLLFPGLFAEVRIPLGPPQPRLVLPESAVLRDQEGDYVFSVTDSGVVERKSVVKGPLQGTDRAIEQGVGEGDRIVVNGIPNIRVGQKVQVLMAEPAAQESPPPQPPTP